MKRFFSIKQKNLRFAGFLFQVAFKINGIFAGNQHSTSLLWNWLGGFG